MQNFPPNVSAYRPGGTGRGHGPRAVAEVLATGSDPRRDRPTCINLYKKNAEGPDGLSTGCHCAHHRFPGFRGGALAYRIEDVLCGMNGKLAATVRYRDPAGSRLPGRSAISARRAAMRTRYPSDPRRRSQPVVLVVNPTPSARLARLRRPSQKRKDPTHISDHDFGPGKSTSKKQNSIGHTARSHCRAWHNSTTVY